MKILAAIFWTGILLGSCAGCAALTEEQKIERQYEQEDHEVQRMEAFYIFERACLAEGGIVVIQRWVATRINQGGPPARGDKVGCAGGGF